MQLSDHRRLMSPQGRNRTPLHVGVTVAACPDDRALCPATAAKPTSERNHARTRFGTAPVGDEADPTSTTDPPLTYRAPESGLHPLSGSWVTQIGNARQPIHACNTELTSNCVYGCCGSSST